MALQNLSFALVDPKGKPVADLPVVASIELPDGTRKPLPAVRSGADGIVRLTRLGPVPFALSLAVADEETTSEWRIQNPEVGELALEEPMGKRVASLPTQLASLAPTAAPSTHIFEGETKQVVVERTILPLTIRGTPGVTLSGAPLPSEGITIPESGSTMVKIPLDALGEGPLPFRAAQALPGGEAEATLRSYPTDPYEPAEITLPSLQLCRLNSVKTPTDLDVLDPIAYTQEAFGDISARKKPKDLIGSVDKPVEGGQWWRWTGAGFSVQTREVFESTPLIERVRLEKPEAGSIGGITAGMPLEKVIEAFGPPQEETPSEKRWLDGGLAVGIQNDRISYLELRRPKYLLERGCGAFVPREPAKLFVESFEGDPRCP
ncbi:MAG: hypothetical protein QM758_10815 [Armatimonas sp.]